MRDSRKSPLLNVLLAVAVLVLAVLCFVLPEAGDRTGSGIVHIPWLSDLLALVCITGTVVSMGLLNYSSFLFTSDAGRLYLPYLLMIIPLPGVMGLSLSHIAAFLMVWSIFFAAGYINEERIRTDYAFGAVLTAGTASVLMPCLVYAEVFIFLYCLYIRGAQSLMRYVLASLAGAAVPWVYLAAAGFIFPVPVSLGNFLHDFRQNAALTVPSFGGMETADAVGMALILLLALRSAVFVLLRGRERNKAQKNAFGLSVALSLVLILSAVFCGGMREPLVVMTAAVPVSFMSFDLFTNGRRTETYIWLILLVLAAAARTVF